MSDLRPATSENQIQATQGPPRPPTRRIFLKRAATTVGVMAAGLFGYTWRIEPHWIEVVNRVLPIAKLPKNLAGKTLVQISDLHIGPIVDESYMAGALQRVSAIQADFVVITGDYMTCDAAEQVPAVARVIANLRPGKIATVGILGNHDYAMGWQNTAAADQLTAMLRGQGITMLRNEKIDIAGLQIAGVDELLAPNFNLRAALGTLDIKQASLVLCHNPDALDESGWSGYQGWILSGHTHGGQCKPPFLPPPLLPVNNRRYTSGPFDLFDGRMVYINRGLGYLYRVRFNARPEINVFTLAVA